MNFIALDFETANQKRHSACSIALVVVQDNQLVGRYYSLIRPQTDFHWRNIQVHGITPRWSKTHRRLKKYGKILNLYFNRALDCGAQCRL